MPTGRPIRGVLFDLDDTLVDRPRSWMAFVDLLDLDAADRAAVHARVLAADQRGYRPKAELFAELAHHLPWRSPTTADRLADLWRERFPTCAVPQPGAADLLATLRRGGVCTAVVTNGLAAGQRAKLDHVGLTALLDAVVISAEVELSKPDPAIFRLALDRIGVAAADALFVGDSPEKDVAPAGRLGLATAWMAHGRTWPATLTRPTYLLSTLSEVAGVVDTSRG